MSPPQHLAASADPCDSVLPGVFISLALRYDYANHVQRRLQADPKSTPTKRDRYVKPYFIAVLVAYVLGLVTTVVVMHRFKAAQPALLYLSPACSEYCLFPAASMLITPVVGAISLLAWTRNEFPATLRWKDEDPSEEMKEDEPESKPSEEEENVDKVFTWAVIARVATCAYLYFGHPKLFPSSRAFDTSTSILLEKSAIIGSESPLQNFLRWDALYYVEIAIDGYRHEQELAFLPGWPLCMRMAGKTVQYIRSIKGSGPATLDVFDVLVGGIVMANVLSVAASVAFYK